MASIVCLIQDPNGNSRYKIFKMPEINLMVVIKMNVDFDLSSSMRLIDIKAKAKLI